MSDLAYWVLFALFAFNGLAILFHRRAVQVLGENSHWINEKSIELLNKEEGEDLIEEIENVHLQNFGYWMYLINTRIMPGILLTSFITSFPLMDVVKDIQPSQLSLFLVAICQAGAIVSIKLVFGWVNQSFNTIKEVNEKYLQLTVEKEIEKADKEIDKLDPEVSKAIEKKIDAEGGNVNGE